jgi:hypothetical protein
VAIECLGYLIASTNQFPLIANMDPPPRGQTGDAKGHQVEANLGLVGSPLGVAINLFYGYPQWAPFWSVFGG